MHAAAEDCAAKATLQGTDGSVGAYDKLPMASASCLFTMDTSTDIFILHSFQVQLCWCLLVALLSPAEVLLQVLGGSCVQTVSPLLL